MEQRVRRPSQLVSQAAEVARLHPPELPCAVRLATCPPDRRDDGRLIPAAADPEQPALDRLDAARPELQDEVEHSLPVF